MIVQSPNEDQDNADERLGLVFFFVAKLQDLGYILNYFLEPAHVFRVPLQLHNWDR